jgi:hypothetical protein
MGVLQFNPDTMPLRKTRGNKKVGGFCQIRKFCCCAIILGAIALLVCLYVDHELARSLNNGYQTQFIRKPMKYLVALADNEDTTANESTISNESKSLGQSPGSRDDFSNNETRSSGDNALVGVIERVNIDPNVLLEAVTVDEDNTAQIKNNKDEFKSLESIAVKNPNDLIGDASIYKSSSEASSEDKSKEDKNGNQQPIESEGNDKVEMKIPFKGYQVSSKPRLYLHVGPQKTGSSTLQTALDIMSGATYEKLGNDNLSYRHITPEEGDFDCELGPWGGFIKCKASGQLLNLIAETRDSGRNLLLTDENLGDQFVQPLRDAIDDNDWTVTVIVVYRRIHEWLVSWYNQINKTTNLDTKGKILLDHKDIPYREEHKFWPSQGGAYIPDFTTWYKEYTKYWKTSELVSKHRSVEYYNLYKSKFSNVMIHNMHEGSDLVAKFFCDIIVDTTESCQKLKNKEVELPKVNPSVNLDHDIIAVYAYDQGLVETALSRQEVTAAVTEYVKRSGKIVPRACNNNITGEIHDWLLDSERLMLANTWSLSKEEELNQIFESYMAKGKLCDVDCEAILHDEDWLRFFRSLGNETPGQIVNNADVVKQTDSIEDMEDLTTYKRNLIIHAGPTRNGLGDIRRLFDSMDVEGQGLQNDNYNYLTLTPFEDYFKCPDYDSHVDDCITTEKFESTISSIETTGQHYLVFNEVLDGRVAVSLKKAIDTSKWQAKVVLSYVRLHELLFKRYIEEIKPLIDMDGNQWPGEGGIDIPTFNTWFRLQTHGWDTSNISKYHPYFGLRDAYISNFEDVEIYDFYKDGSFARNLVCDYLPGASQTCQILIDNNERSEAVNSHASLGKIDQNILAVSAHRSGLIRNDLSRQHVVDAIRNKLESNGSTLPRACTIDITEQIHEWVIESEKQMCGQTWRSKRISDITADFESVVRSGILCAVDIKKILQDQGWVIFFQSL